MIIDVGIKPYLSISDVAEVFIDKGFPDLVVYGRFRSEGKRTLRDLNSIVDEIRQSSPRNLFTFSSDRILDAAGRYFIVHEPCVIEGRHYDGLAKRWNNDDRRFYAAIDEKADVETVVHELIHLAHGYFYKNVMISPEDEDSANNLESAIEIAVQLFLDYIPKLPFDIRDAQIGKVLEIIERLGMKGCLNTAENIDRNRSFCRDYIPRLNKSWEDFHVEQAFNLNGVFNNYYWEEIRAVLLGGNFQAPARQKFLFEF